MNTTGKFQPRPQALAWLRFGEVRPAGWMRAQMLRDLEDGFTGHLDELVPGLIREDDIYGADRLTLKNRSKDLGVVAVEKEWAVQFLWWNSETQSNWRDGLLRSALLLSEDKRFYEHSGVDWRAASAAAWANLWNQKTRGADVPDYTERNVDMAGLPDLMYGFARQIPALHDITTPADGELDYVGKLLLAGGGPNVSQLMVWEVMTWGMLSHAERLRPGGLLEGSQTPPKISH